MIAYEIISITWASWSVAYIHRMHTFFPTSLEEPKKSKILDELKNHYFIQ